MKYHQLIQGTAEWHALRSGHFTASEAPAMMGASPKVGRTELLKMKATGSEREFSDWVQRNLFDKGHEYEANARPIIEELIGDELYPATGTKEVDGLPLLASFDGLTMLADTNFEHKMWNESLAQKVREKNLPDEYKWQLDQQMMISGAEKTIFVVSDGTNENLERMQYDANPDRFKQLIAGWKQFNDDLANYTPTEVKAKPVGRTPENLPALRIELTGSVTTSNLNEFKAHALGVLSEINRDLVTDQDFSDAEKTVKWCSEVERKLDAAKSHALSQTASIEEVFRSVDEVKEEVKRLRLELDRQVKTEKENRRMQIRLAAEDDYSKHLQALNNRLGGAYLPEIECDIVGAMKGKRNIESLEDAANTAVANAKINASQWADKIGGNLATLMSLGESHLFLFVDKKSLVLREPSELKDLIKARILKHDAEINAREEAETKAKAQAIEAAKEVKKQAAKQEAEVPEPAAQEVEPNQQPSLIAKDSPAPWDLERETVTMSLHECQRLQESDALLQALIKAGVESWDGYHEALSSIREAATA